MKRALRVIAIGTVVVILATVLGVELLAQLRRSAARIETPNGIEVLEYVEIGGVRQALYLRGHDRDAPVLLFVHGGPGAASTAIARQTGLALEEHFVVAHWDQRGAGNSCSSEVPDDSLTLERHLADAREVIDYLRDRFDERAVVLVGHSWGSVLGVMTVQRHPELVHAYVGLGQVVDMRRNEEISYRFVVDRAKAEGNEAALAELATVRPPYGGREGLMLQRKWLSHYRGDLREGNGFVRMARALVLSPEYGTAAKLAFYSCAMNSLDQTWHEIESVDFLSSAPSLSVPVFFFVGRHDYNTPFELAEEYFEALEAPYKELVWFENSAHSPNLEEPDRYQRQLIERVLPLVAAGGP